MRSLVLILLVLKGACGVWAQSDAPLRPGAQRMEEYMALIGEKKIALVVNQTSLVDRLHLIDTLLSAGISRDQVKALFCPEHGFRGDRVAGQTVEDSKDPVTGIPVVSLYGKNKKPAPGHLAGVDLVLFDLQDVGVRFYTYISTLHYVMEACAENGVPLVVLDRPNPNGGYVDGPVMEAGYTSFVGMHPIPVVYGLTIGELALMINGEGWLAGNVSCDLRIIPCAGYSHGGPVSLRVAPSPNLRCDHAIRLYPSTCFFEGTVLSEGRGTPMPFEVYGHPHMTGGFTFTPVAIPGVAENPKHKGRLCYGEDLRAYTPEGGWTCIHLEFLLDAYRKYPRKEEFFTPYFEKLAGTANLRNQIEAGWDENHIRASWQAGLENYLRIREKYLIYD